MAADWSDMPVDILDQIVDKFNSVEELLSFSIVCHSWHSVYERAKPEWSPQMPWLMLAESTKDNLNDFRKFFDPSTSKCYQLKFPKTFLCWGSAYGWIVAMNFDFEISMFNPITGAHLKLPHARTLPHCQTYPLDTEDIDKDDPEDIKVFCRSMLDRIILLKIPGWGNEEILAVSISADLISVGIARPNDMTWIPVIVGDTRRHVIDATYCDGSLFLIDKKGAISCVELEDGVMDQVFLRTTIYSPPPRDDLMDTLKDTMYLTASSGHILVVLRIRRYINDAIEHFEADDPIYRTQKFIVYKLSKETKAWEPLKDLGELSIFVGANSTMLIQTCATAYCRRNCIYFTDDFWDNWSHPKELGGHDMGIYSLKDNSDKHRLSTKLEPIYQGEDSHGRYCCPLWFIPKF